MLFIPTSSNTGNYASEPKNGIFPSYKFSNCDVYYLSNVFPASKSSAVSGIYYVEYVH